ncbi:MAG: carboxypeptidase regulatory-like domain-containing protein, partial [Pyrinomonadaceae bacterium]|nr:carboxypeptidase regulatory-like domain-containing protein [Pyrinomonadaceae bacterium]
MMRSKWLLNLVVTAMIFVFAGAAQGQVTTGRISGTVTDPNGAVVSGAGVTVTNVETNSAQQATTGGDGEFAFQLLPPGRYKIEIASAGFQNTQAEVVVNITQTTTVELRLGVSGSTDIVNVEPLTPVLQDETSQNGRVIESETLRQIPLATRNFQQLLTLSAGAQSSVANSTDLGRGDAIISVNGQRTTSNSVR